jgi:glycerol-3-phosphate acyltransferase PlsX
MQTPIALDAMGGDRMPDAAIDGALAASRDGLPVLLVGDEATLRAGLARRDGQLEVVHAGDVIGMDEHAAEVRRRRDSSVSVAARLVKEGRASALVSMGHSGATMAAALFAVRRAPGVERPAIVANIPSKRGPVALLDVGANADCRPRMLQQFAVMGSAYARLVFGRDDPGVGLVSIGEEPSKGDELARASYPLLAETPGIRFHGNVEGRDLLAGTTDVMVTDGFTGNVMLKLAEGEARVLFDWIREALRADLRSRLGALLARPALRSVAARLDPGTYGAQLLLGVGAPAFIGHGSSDARAVRSALGFAGRIVEERLVERIGDELAAADAA